MPGVANVRVQPFASLNMHYVEQLKDGWDWPLSQKNSLPEFVESFQGDRHFIGFWATVNDEPCGLISFRPYSEQPATTLSFGIFIHKDKRVSGLATLLMGSAIKAMQEIQVPMVATVHEDNIRSLKMIQRTTQQPGILIYEPTKNRNAYLFTLDKTSCLVNTFDESCVEDILRESHEFVNLL